MKKDFPVWRIFVAWFALQSSVLAGTKWEQTSGSVPLNFNSFTVQKNQIYAGTDHGIFCSDDAGATWKNANTKLTDTITVYDVGIIGTTLLAGAAFNNGVYRSTDSGMTWTRSNSGLTGTYMESFAVRGNKVFAACDGVALSLDSGKTWSPVNSGLTYRFVKALAMIGTDLFAGTYGGGVFVSRDSGARWDSVNSGLTNLFIQKLAVQDTVIYAVTNSGVFRSTTRGTNWMDVTSNLPSRSMAAFTALGSALFAGSNNGIYCSTNKGTSWNPVNTNLPLTTWYTALAVCQKNLVAGTSAGITGYKSAGVFCSPDSGKSWTPVSVGFQNFEVSCLAGNANYLVAGSRKGVYVSANSGAAWTLTSAPQRCTAVAASGTTLFSSYFNGTGYGGVYMSTDGGNLWSTSTVKLNYDTIPAIVANNGRLYAAMSGYGGIYRSADNGASWTVKNSGLPLSPAADVEVLSLGLYGDTLFAGMYNGLFVSKNQAETWTSAGLAQQITCFAACGNILYAGTSKNGIFVSTDNATSWHQVNSGLRGLTIHSLASYNRNIFAATNGGVSLSSNDGISWTAADSGLAKDTVLSLVVRGDTLYAGMEKSGVWRLALKNAVPVNPGRALKACRLSSDLCAKGGLHAALVAAFTVSRAQHVTLSIYDPKGCRTVTLVDNRVTAGRHSAAWVGKSTISGFYVVKLETEEGMIIKKIAWLQ